MDTDETKSTSASETKAVEITPADQEGTIAANDSGVLEEIAPPSFKENWWAETGWFHSVDEKAMAEQYDKHHQPLVTAIQAKKSEIAKIKVRINAEENETEMAEALEQSQWHSATQESHQLGMAVSQARCLIMLEAGFLTFEEIFKKDNLFGIYSQSDIVRQPGKVAEACKSIDILYLNYLQMKNPKDHFSFLKRHIHEQVSRTRSLTRKQAHDDLSRVYSGYNSEPEDPGYKTDDGYETELELPSSSL